MALLQVANQDKLETDATLEPGQMDKQRAK